MQESQYVLSEIQEINPLLYKPINSTQRIKYTCMNVSASYIILGSTSGSLYLFSRESCIFQQVIPLSEGAVSRVQVSPDEKIIALSTIRGTICLVVLKPSVKLVAVSTDHLREEITSLCWNHNSNEIYIGDGNGKISVMILSFFTVNGMFRAPSSILMHLDSNIVQMSFSPPFLLVSTLTRCYVCDTVQEQYKQIGNKTRDGEFGACFYKEGNEKHERAPSEKEERISSRLNSFSLISEGENNVTLDNYPKIYCSRPGARLWEVSANGIVVKTHQFKEALAIPPTEICRLYDSSKEQFQAHHKNNTQVINFSRLYVISQKYLFTFTSNGIYIIDPVNEAVILWNDELENITAVEIINNEIYIMTNDITFHCLKLSSIDSLILCLYNRKKFKECLKACTNLQSTLMKSLVRKDGEINEESSEIAEQLLPIISLLQSNEKQPVKLKSGIVVVNSGNNGLKNGTCNHQEKETESKSNLSPSTSHEESSDLQDLKELAEVNSNENTIYQIQNDLQPIYVLMNNSIKNLTAEEKAEDLIKEVTRIFDEVQVKYVKDLEFKYCLYEITRVAELHYHNTLLENISLDLIRETRNEIVIQEVYKCFVDLNTSSKAECSCGFLCPTGPLKEPKFLEIGKILLDKFLLDRNKCINFCKRVPFIWREYLPLCIRKNYDLMEIVPLCLQTNDNIILSIVLPVLSDDQWQRSVKYLRNLENGICSFCDKSIEKNGITMKSVINWNGVSHELMKKQGPDDTIKFLSKVQSFVPNISFDKRIFQSLIFTKILETHGVKHAVENTRNHTSEKEYNTLCSPQVRDKVVKALEKDLEIPVEKEVLSTGSYHWGMRYKSKSSICPCCTLSLQTPVLLGNNGIALFPCGHTYHVNCLIERKLSRCNLHS